MLTLLINLLQVGVIVQLSVLSGIALCLWQWVMPIIMLPQLPSSCIVAQFEQVIDRGLKYLMPISRASVANLVILVLLTAQSNDAELAGKWPYYVLSAVVLGQVIWYEIVFIFPTNDQIIDMRGGFEAAEKDGRSTEEERKVLFKLMESWIYHHRVRVAVPLLGALIACYASVR